MRILHVMAGGKHGGAETACVDMCIAMREAGQDVAIATRPNDLRVSRLEKAGVKVYTMRFGGLFDLASAAKLKNAIKDFKPDIVQGWMSRGSSYIPRWQPSMSIPAYKTVSRLGGYYAMKYFRNIDFFVGITPCIKMYLQKQGVSDTHVTFINNFADIDPPQTQIKREDYGIPHDAILLMGLGRLHTSKAFDILIQAVAQIEGVYLWIAGEGPERKTLEALVKTLGLENRVILPGWQEDRAALFQASDICVFPSRYEPFGTVFAQSWSQGTPVIVSDADGPRQFVRDGEDGLVVPRDDIEALRDAIEKLRHDKALAGKFIANGQQRFQDEFTKERCVKNYLEFYGALKKLK